MILTHPIEHMTDPANNPFPFRVVNPQVWGVRFPTEARALAFRNLSPTLVATTIALSVEDALRRLYNSEINVRLESFWDGGWDWSLGDPMNHFDATGHAWDLTTAVHLLALAAIATYPTIDLAINGAPA